MFIASNIEEIFVEAKRKSNLWVKSFWVLVWGCLLSLLSYFMMVYSPVIKKNKDGFLLKIEKREQAKNDSSFVELESVDQYIGIYRVKKKFANVRIGPGKIFELRKVFPRNKMVKIIEQRGSWLRIDQGNWIARSSLSEL